MREFMSGPVQFLQRALLPLDYSNDHWAARGGQGRPSIVAAAAAAAAAANASGSSGGGAGGGGGGGVNAVHESLVKVLLRVDCIQPQVLTAEAYQSVTFLVIYGVTA